MTQPTPVDAPASTCECGEPNCVYVANLTAVTDWLRAQTTEETSR